MTLLLRAALWIVERASPPALAPDVAADLCDEFAARERARGVRAAERWVLKEAARSAAPLLLRRAQIGGATDPIVMIAAGIASVAPAMVVLGLHLLGDLVRTLVPMREGTSPLTAYLFATLFLGLCAAGACASLFALARPKTRWGFVLGVAAAAFVTISAPISSANFPSWYFAAYWALGPCAALIGTQIVRGMK